MIDYYTTGLFLETVIFQICDGNVIVMTFNHFLALYKHCCWVGQQLSMQIFRGMQLRRIHTVHVRLNSQFFWQPHINCILSVVRVIIFITDGGNKIGIMNLFTAQCHYRSLPMAVNDNTRCHIHSRLVLRQRKSRNYVVFKTHARVERVSETMVICSWCCKLDLLPLLLSCQTPRSNHENVVSLSLSLYPSWYVVRFVH